MFLWSATYYYDAFYNRANYTFGGEERIYTAILESNPRWHRVGVTDRS